MNYAFKCFKSLISYRKKDFSALLILIFLSSIFEFLTISFLTPFLFFILDGSNINNFGESFLASISRNFELESILLLLVVSVILSNFLKGLLQWKQAYFSYLLGADISTSIYKAETSRPFNILTKRNIGSILALIFKKVDDVVGQVIDPIIRLFSSFIMTIFIMSALIYATGFIPLIIGIMAAMLFGFFYLIIRTKLALHSNTINFEYGNSMRIARETFHSAKEIIIGSWHPYFIKKFSDSIYSFKNSQANVQAISALPKFLFDAVFISAILILMSYNFTKNGNSESMQSLFPILGVILFSTLRLIPNLQTIFTSISIIKSSKVNFQEVTNFLNTSKIFLIQKSSNVRSHEFKDKIQLKNVSFEYEESKGSIFNKLNLEIKKGEKILIVGESGAGKSSLLDVIMGLKTINSGQVSIDNRVISSIADLPKISHVSQDIFLLDSSISENIAFGIERSDINHERIKSLIDQLNLNGLISKLPQGVNTIIGDQGSKLSGGQRQRIAIARALYYDHELVILDEATSALDPETESKILKNILSHESKKTVIMVTHRKNLARYFDSIYELKNHKLYKFSTKKS